MCRPVLKRVCYNSPTWYIEREFKIGTLAKPPKLANYRRMYIMIVVSAGRNSSEHKHAAGRSKYDSLWDYRPRWPQHLSTVTTTRAVCMCFWKYQEKRVRHYFGRDGISTGLSQLSKIIQGKNLKNK